MDVWARISEAIASAESEIPLDPPCNSVLGTI